MHARAAAIATFPFECAVLTSTWVVWARERQAPGKPDESGIERADKAHESQTCTSSVRRAAARHIFPAAPRAASNSSTSKSCRCSTSRRRSPPSMSNLWRRPSPPPAPRPAPAQHHTRARAAAAPRGAHFARDAALEVDEHAKPRVLTVGELQQLERRVEDVAECADRAHNRLELGSSVEDNDARCSSRAQPPQRPHWRSTMPHGLSRCGQV